MATPTYNPHEQRYWEADDLLAEERRQYEVCNGCRLCWNLCPAFPALFDACDEVDADLNQLDRAKIDGIEDLCFQCKLCWVVCPYTDPHEYNMDVPRLIERSKYQRAKKDGVKLSKKLTADQDRLAKLGGGVAAPLTNFANKFGPSRKIVGMIMDVHPDAVLPEYKTQTLQSWFKKTYGDAIKPAEPIRKVAFFASCTINNAETDIGKAAIRVLEHNNVEVVMPEQQCCGMPLSDAGDFDAASKKMDYNLERLSALVDQGYDVVVPQPTCTLVIRDDYPVRSKEAEVAKKVAEHTFEVGHFLTTMAREKELLRDFKYSLGKIAFHVACHTRRQAVGNNAPRLLGIVPGTEVTSYENCSGHDGSWGISRQYFPLSLKVGEKLFDNLKSGSPDVLVTDCPLAGHHIQVGTKTRPIHSAQALAAAYGLEGAPEGVAKPLPEEHSERTEE